MAGEPERLITACELPAEQVAAPAEQVAAPPEPPECPGPVCFPPSQIFHFEDTDSVMLAPWHDHADQLALMIQAANALIAQYGDEFDFIGFYTAFEPAFKLGGAFHTAVKNDASGIGLNPFDRHAFFGISGSRLQSMVMLYATHQTGVNPETCEPGVSPMFHEIGHRWAVWLPNLADGRRLQGDNAGCGSGGHWGFYVDCQWSSLQCLEWVGDQPVKNNGDFPNTDTGGWLSLLEVYLMGYISAEEMDALMSEQRYLDEGCNDPYNGNVSTYSSADIVAVAGERFPTVEFAQKDFKTAWVVIHQPGAPPTPSELDNLGLKVEKFTSDWSITTLGRGTMTSTLFSDCNCNGVPDDEELASGASTDINGNASPDECDFLVFLGSDDAGLSWNDLSIATGYDLVRGDLQLLIQSGGDFSQASIECLGNDLSETSIPLAATPDPGQGFWFLARAELASGPGTYDTGIASQAGSRDFEIDAAAAACP